MVFVPPVVIFGLFYYLIISTSRLKLFYRKTLESQGVFGKLPQASSPFGEDASEQLLGEPGAVLAGPHGLELAEDARPIEAGLEEQLQVLAERRPAAPSPNDASARRAAAKV